MPGSLFLYLVVLVVAAFLLWGAYRVLGTPSRLRPGDYTLVLTDVATSVGRAAGRLRAATDSASDLRALEDAATETRKIFQTGYYQALRLRPATGPDGAASIRQTLGRACEAYDWASRMIGTESSANPLILAAARGLLDAGDAELKASVAALGETTGAPTGSNSP